MSIYITSGVNLLVVNSIYIIIHQPVEFHQPTYKRDDNSPIHGLIYQYIISGWWYTYPSEKYEFVNGKDYPIYIMEKIINMFQTTNQILSTGDVHCYFILSLLFDN